MSDAGGSKPLVLIVEDDQQIAYMMQYVLEKEGYAVETAANMEEALELIATLAPPALVTMDIRLPDGSGVDLIVKIRETPGWEQVPIVMCTATPKDQNTNWAVKAGAKSYIVKPFKPELLRDTVKKYARPVTG
jgi:two-component system, OmpR family, alkaline phosphatase synthesis response regulator PhoP